MTSPLIGLYPNERWLLDRVDPSEGCWKWHGCLDAYGYGVVRHRNVIYKVHRAVYELLVGPIPAGLTIDHLCRNRSCCNPNHMEPVTSGENVRRAFKGRAKRTHCRNGHLLDEDNSYIWNGYAQCRACNLIYTHRKRGLPDDHVSTTKQAKSHDRGKLPLRAPVIMSRSAKKKPGTKELSMLEKICRGLAIGNGCWNWDGPLDKYGYGIINVRESGKCKRIFAHRAVYSFVIGEIPHGLVLDHLCRNRRCVRPDHLEPVTQTENMKRSWPFHPHNCGGRPLSTKNTTSEVR